MPKQIIKKITDVRKQIPCTSLIQGNKFYVLHRYKEINSVSKTYMKLS